MRIATPLLFLFLAACLGRANHPIMTTVESPPLEGEVPTDLEEPPTPSGAQAEAALFMGLANVQGPLSVLRRQATGVGQPPRLVGLPKVERAVRARFRGGSPLGRVRHVAAFGHSAASPLPPRAMADLLMDPAEERRALGADTFQRLAVDFSAGGTTRHSYRVEMLRRGMGLFRFDFRFRTTTERWDLPDGRVLMRYDPHPDPRGKGVTLYRGVCVIEPLVTGSMVTEMVILGTDISVPFFLEGEMRKNSLKLFRERLEKLWRSAAARARAAGR